MDVEETVLTWREEGATLVDALVAAMVPGVDKVLEEDEIALWFIATTIKSQAIQSISAPSERKTSEKCTYLCHYSR